MLDALRQQAGGWVARVLIAILVVSFGIWGVSDMFGSTSTNIVAQVGSVDVRTVDYQQAYQQQMNALAQENGRAITLQESLSENIPSIVLGQMVATAVIEDQAARLGLAISDAGVGRLVAAEPSFQSDGVFNPTLFQNFLRSANVSEAAIVADFRKTALRNQLLGAITEGLVAPEALSDALLAYFLEERTVRYLRLTADGLDTAPTPTEEQLTAYYNENSGLWQAPELRSLVVMEINPTALANPAAVTEEQAQAAYQADIARYTTPERRHVSQFIFPTAARATEVEAMLATGRTYADLVTAGDIAPTDLGTVERSALFDPAVAEAAFTLETNGSVVTTGRSGRVLVHVDEIEASFTVPFDVVRELVVAGAAEDAVTNIDDLYLQVEDTRSGGATLTEVAAQLNVPVRIIEIAADGTDAAGEAVTDVPGGNELIGAAFESDVGLVSPPVEISRNDIIFFEVTSIAPARQRALDEVRDQVVAGWVAEETRKELRELAIALSDRLKSGESFETIATERGLTIGTSTYTRSDQDPDGLSRSVAGIGFTGPSGSIGYGEDTDGSFVVIQSISAATPETGTASDEATVNAQLEGWAVELGNAYVTDLQNRASISTNPAAINLAIGATTVN